MPDITQTSIAQPYAGLEPYLTDLYGRAQGAANATPGTAPQGSLLAPVNNAQLFGNQGRINLGQANMNAGQNAINLGQRTLGGEFVDQSSNPYFLPALQASYRPLMDELTNSVIPGITSAATRQGARDSTSYDNYKTGAVAQTTGRISDSIAKAVADNYMAERQMQLQAPQMIGQGMELSRAPLDMISQGGEQQRKWEQEPIEASLRRYQLDTEAPWQGVQRYGQAIGAVPAGGGTSMGTRTETPTSGESASNVLSGGLGGAALGGLLGYGLGGGASAFPGGPLSSGFLSSGYGLGGIAGGAGLGALLGGLFR